MNLLLDILDVMVVGVPGVFLCTLLLLAWLGIIWLRGRRAKRKKKLRDHETKIRRQWDRYGFDAWDEWQRQKQEQGR